MYRILFFVLSLTLFISCDKQNIEPPRDTFGLEYYPLSIGNTWTYEMDSIIVRAVVSGYNLDSVRVQMQELLVDTFTDNSGQLWYRGERSFRANDSEDWRFASIFLLGINERGGLRKEGNLQFVPLGFPALQGHRWDGNSAFSEFTEVGVGGEVLYMFRGWNYQIIASAEPSISPEPSFPDIIRVEAADDDGLIEKRFVIETYAKDIGLIYRELEILDTQCHRCCRLTNGEADTELCLTVNWRDKVEEGFYLRQRLIDFQP